MADPTYKSGIGRLAVDRYDFQEHIDGYAFKHKAVGIISDPPYSQFGGATNLQAILGELAAFVDEQNAAGQGFVTVGDGLDTWHAADGNINYDNSIPALDTILNPIFTAIYNNTPLDPEYERLKFGGIVLIKSGTYIVRDTIEVPPGITIIGEGYGTKIVNAIRLDITTQPPTRDLGMTAKPVFLVKVDPSRNINDAAVDSDLFMFSRDTKIMNLVIADNFVENTILGDVFYKLPLNIAGDNPLIKQEAGSSLQLKSLKLIGRATFTSGKIVSEATRYAVQLDNTTGTTTGTHLVVDDCFIDGFSQPIYFPSIGGVKDYLTVEKCKIRSHGYLDADGSGRENNCIIRMNDNNLNMIGNELFGNHSSFDTVVYVKGALTPPLVENNKPKILISSNNFVVDRGTATSVTPRWVEIDAGISATFRDNASLLLFGNNFNYLSGFAIDATTASMNLSESSASLSTNGNLYLTADAGGQITTTNSPFSMQLGTGQLTVNAGAIILAGTGLSAFTGGLYHSVTTYTGAPLTSFNIGNGQFIILCDSTAADVVLNLPAHVAGRVLIIKDAVGFAGTNPIHLVRDGGTGNIDDFAGDRDIATDWACWTLVSDGTNWLIV